MNDPRYEKLIHDIVGDAAEDFRQELFKATVKELRRRRAKAKPAVPPWAIAAGIVFGAGILFSGLSHRTPVPEGAERAEVSTPASNHEFPPIAIVSAAPPMALVKSQSYPTLVVENPNSNSPPELLGDAELLALFPDKPAGLIADFRGAVRFVFLNPNDQAAISHF